jgi:lipoprotein-releasing system ATP-binding protein
VVFEVLVGLARSRGTAVVIVTHDPELAAKCDRVLRLNHGRLAPA